jgi:hypothetical protein
MPKKFTIKIEIDFKEAQSMQYKELEREVKRRFEEAWRPAIAKFFDGTDLSKE